MTGLLSSFLPAFSRLSDDATISVDSVWAVGEIEVDRRSCVEESEV